MCWLPPVKTGYWLWLPEIKPAELSSSLGGRNGGSPLDGGLLGYNTESLTVNHSRQHVWRVPRSLLNLSSLPNSPYFFSDSQKSLIRVTHPFPHFCIVIKYYWACYCPEYSWNTARWTLSNNQSINQSQIKGELTG